MNQSYINSDNCDIGNIVLEIDPNQAYIQNKFKGRVHVESLSQFFKMFYP